MQAIGVICEFNPFHEGHAYLLRRARETVGPDGCVVCAMSGRFVQRGTAAIADPYLRAECALLGGADLVVELPFPWSAGSAEHFAAAGVHILASLGVDALAFGSECGDEVLLRRAALAVSSADFADAYAALCRNGRGTAAAYAEALHASLGAGLPEGFPSSNDFLGIAYLAALERIRAASGTAPDTLIVRREGASYREDTLAAEGYPSATALRRLIFEAWQDLDALEAMLTGTMPDEALDRLLHAIERELMPIDGNRLLPFYHAYYRLQTFDTVEKFAECGGGLASLICARAADSASPEGFFEALRSRRYTDARLRRALLYGAVGVADDDLCTMPAYSLLLGANERGRAYLKVWQRAHRDDPDFRVVTKPADAPEGRQRTLSERADGLFTLCFPTPQAAGYLLKKSPVIQ